MLDIDSARALIARTRPRPSREGYPAEVRAEVVLLARRLLNLGRSRSGVARDLGLHAKTLVNWLGGDAAPQPGFVSVFLTSSDPVSRPAPLLAVVSPTGYRIEGLDLASAIEVLSRLSS